MILFSVFPGLGSHYTRSLVIQPNTSLCVPLQLTMGSYGAKVALFAVIPRQYCLLQRHCLATNRSRGCAALSTALHCTVTASPLGSVSAIGPDATVEGGHRARNRGRTARRGACPGTTTTNMLYLPCLCFASFCSDLASSLFTAKQHDGANLTHRPQKPGFIQDAMINQRPQWDVHQGR